MNGVQCNAKISLALFLNFSDSLLTEQTLVMFQATYKHHNLSFLNSVICGYVVIMSVYIGVNATPAHHEAKLLFTLTIVVQATCPYFKWTCAHFSQHLTRQ